MSPIPSYVERTSYGTKETNPYNKLFEERVIFLGTPIEPFPLCVGFAGL